MAVLRPPASPVPAPCRNTGSSSKLLDKRPVQSVYCFILSQFSKNRQGSRAGRGWSPGGQKDRPGRFPLVCPFGFRKDYPGLRTAAPRRERLHKPRAAPAMQRRPAADARTDLQTPADTGAGPASAGPPAPDPQRLKKPNPLKPLKFQGIFGDPPEIRTPDPLLKRQLLCQLS